MAQEHFTRYFDMNEWDKIGHVKKRAMLSALAQLGVVTAAAEAAGLQRRQTHYVWLKTDPDYGLRVAKGLSLDVNLVERLAEMSQEERAKATEEEDLA